MYSLKFNVLRARLHQIAKLTLHFAFVKAIWYNTRRLGVDESGVWEKIKKFIPKFASSKASAVL